MAGTNSLHSSRSKYRCSDDFDGSVVSYVIQSMHYEITTALILHVKKKILLPRSGGLILFLYLDMKSVEEAVTMIGVALVDLTVVGIAAGLTNQMKMTGQSLFPQVNAWNSK